MNIGESIKYLQEAKKAKAALNQRIKEIDEARAPIEEELIRQIQAQGVDGLHVGDTSVTISEQSFGDIENYEAFEAHIKETDSLFLLQRRLSQAAYNDLKAAGETIPGVKDFTKVTLSIRKRP